MGIGIVTGWDGKVYLVCSYDPAANVDGEFQRNVAQPKEVRIIEIFSQAAYFSRKLILMSCQKLRVYSG